MHSSSEVTPFDNHAVESSSSAPSSDPKQVKIHTHLDRKETNLETKHHNPKKQGTPQTRENTPDKFFYSTLTTEEYFDQLVKWGCDEAELTKVFSSHAIKNYHVLQQSVSHIIYQHRKKLKAWELLCMSGDLSALEYAQKHEQLSGVSTGLYDTNALHWAALSGSTEAMDFTIKTLNISPFSTDDEKQNALHYATLGGTVSAITYAIETLKIPPHSVDASGLTALHEAARSHSKEAVDYAINILKIPAHTVNQFGLNVLHSAAISGSAEMMALAVAIGVNPHAVDVNGMNALHWAALYGHKEAVAFAIETLLIPAQSVCYAKRNILHYAAESGSIEAIHYIRQLNADHDLGLDPMVRDAHGHNAFYWAEKSHNALQAREALLELVLSSSKKPITSKGNITFFNRFNFAETKDEDDQELFKKALENTVIKEERYYISIKRTPSFSYIEKSAITKNLTKHLYTLGYQFPTLVVVPMETMIYIQGIEVDELEKIIQGIIQPKQTSEKTCCVIL